MNTYRRAAFGLFEWVVCLAVLASATLIAATAYARARASTFAQECASNLDALAAAKASWAFDHHKPGGAMPTDKDLFGCYGYLVAKPVCPAGGAYSWRRVDEAPICSLADSQGHQVNGDNPRHGQWRLHRSR